MRQKENQRLVPGVQEHLRSLGFSSLDEYRVWCAANRLRCGLRKGQKEKGRERELRTEQLRRGCWEERFPKSAVDKTVSEMYHLLLLFGQRSGSQQLARHRYLDSLRPVFSQARQTPGAPETLAALLSRVHRAELEQSGQFSRFQSNVTSWLMQLALRHSWWIRPAEDWVPTNLEPKTLLHDAARHLLARYPVPALFDEVWQKGCGVRQHWFRTVGLGYNLAGQELPVPLTRKMVHLLMTEPPEALTLDESLRWAQARGFGASSELARAIATIRMAEPLPANEFWENLLPFLVREEAQIPLRQVGPLIDYLRYEREAPREIGDTQRLPANFTLNGRTAAVLLERMEAWHAALKWRGRFTVHRWPSSGIPGWNEGEETDGWELLEILEANVLMAEGEAMRHCVVSYGHRCISGDVSIWSLRRKTTEGTRRVMTVRVGKDRVLAEARGLCNSSPRYTGGEPLLQEGAAVLKRWAATVGLRIASDVL